MSCAFILIFSIQHNQSQLFKNEQQLYIYYHQQAILNKNIRVASQIKVNNGLQQIFEQKSMQLNCILFPGKSNTDISQIYNDIVLIPAQLEKSHIYYSTYLSSRSKPKNMLSLVASNSKQCSKQSQIQYNLTMHTEQSTFNENINCQKERKQANIKDNGQQIQLQTNKTQGDQIFLHDNQQIELIKVSGFIPCLFIPGSQKLIVYFHGNAEDLASTSDFVNFINRKMGYSVIAMEYPGYSVYEGSSTSQKIQADSLTLINYLLKIGFSLQNMFVMGRSIGTGPALFVSSYFKAAGLMLISPFLSISALIKDKYGSIASFLVKQRFQNYKVIQNVTIPVFILHGMMDTIVPYNHSYKLQELAGGKCYVKLIEKMTHGAFDFKNDFLEPLRSFIKIIKF